MGPEFLFAGFVLLQRLVLRGGRTGCPNGKDGCERKNGSMERRFHRVSPSSSHRAAMLFLICLKWANSSRAQKPITSSDGEKRAACSLQACIGKYILRSAKK